MNVPVIDIGLAAIKCHKCGHPMRIKKAIRGLFLKCSFAPRCRATAPLPETMKKQIIAVGRSILENEPKPDFVVES